MFKGHSILIRLFSSIVVALIGAAAANTSIAQSQPQAPASALPSDEQLDALLEAGDWKGLGAALMPATRDEALTRAMAWLHRRIDSGGGSFLGFVYARDLWGLGSALNGNDPMKDMRVTAGLIVLYTFELIRIDGAKCEDRSAPGHRVDLLLINYQPTLAYVKAKPADLKASIVGLAIAMEKHTAPLRKDDNWLCRGGLAEMRAGIETGTTKEVPTPPGYYGETRAIEAPPNWTPKFLAPETYKPVQDQLRSEMKSSLLKLVE